tara:strand:+ start:1963 stop:2136 length:174 start_codon:yes stop_codon:yes gene_type:complete
VQVNGILLGYLEPLIVEFRLELLRFRLTYNASFARLVLRLLVAQVTPFTSLTAATFG